MRTLAHVEHVLWLTCFVCAGYCIFLGVRGHEYRNFAEQIGKPQGAANASAVRDVISGKVIGRIDIPALALSAPIASDYDADSLRKGVGHIRGTAMPGGLGTVGLAGHRDTFFSPLRRITPKMEVRLIDKTGTYHYIVDSTEIVTPDKVEVLATGERPELTLITCFPFAYVGAAPKRFIVHAHLLSALPDRRPAVR
jgi:sortase A